MFSFSHTSTSENYTLSLHDALPISLKQQEIQVNWPLLEQYISNVEKIQRKTSIEGKLEIKDLLHIDHIFMIEEETELDRKSTRLNSSHVAISYAVFCLKKKRNTEKM